jgi:hypothetical protein
MCKGTSVYLLTGQMSPYTLVITLIITLAIIMPHRISTSIPLPKNSSSPTVFTVHHLHYHPPSSLFTVFIIVCHLHRPLFSPFITISTIIHRLHVTSPSSIPPPPLPLLRLHLRLHIRLHLNKLLPPSEVINPARNPHRMHSTEPRKHLGRHSCPSPIERSHLFSLLITTTSPALTELALLNNN